MALEQNISALIRIANLPGRVIARLAAVFVAPYVVFAFLASRARPGVFSTLLLVLAVILALTVAFFAWLQDRLAKLVDEAELRTASSQVTVYEPRSPEDLLAEQVHKMVEFDDERRLHRDTWMPRVEAMQRAFVRAAGGVENAPYLKDDLRITIIALVGSLAAIPLSAIGTFLSLLQILG